MLGESVRGVAGRERPRTRTSGDDFVADLEAELPGEDEEALAMRGVDMQWWSGSAGVHRHLDDAEVLPTVKAAQQDDEGVSASPTRSDYA